MPTIVFASSKGGAGKTTAAISLAFVTSHHGTPTTIIDADPNRPIATWAERNPEQVPANLTVVTALRDDVMEAIDSATTPLTIVDLEGSKNQDVSVGIGRADLVIIPLSGSRLDADEATAVIRVVKRQEAAFRRTIPFRLMLTRVSTIKDRVQKDIVAQFEAAKLPMLQTALRERAAFKAIFHIGKTLYAMGPEDTAKPQAAIEDAEALTAEIRKVLSEVMNTTQGKEMAHV